LELNHLLLIYPSLIVRGDGLKQLETMGRILFFMGQNLHLIHLFASFDW